MSRTWFSRDEDRGLVAQVGGRGKFLIPVGSQRWQPQGVYEYQEVQHRERSIAVKLLSEKPWQGFDKCQDTIFPPDPWEDYQKTYGRGLHASANRIGYLVYYKSSETPERRAARIQQQKNEYLAKAKQDAAAKYKDDFAVIQRLQDAGLDVWAVVRTSSGKDVRLEDFGWGENVVDVFYYHRCTIPGKLPEVRFWPLASGQWTGQVIDSCPPDRLEVEIRKAQC